MEVRKAVIITKQRQRLREKHFELTLTAGLPDWTFLGPNLQNLDHFNHVWTKKKLFGPFELKVWTFLRF